MTNHEDSASAGASATAATEEVLVLNGIYRAGELIGKGSFGEVRRGRNLETNQEIAVKIVDLRKIMDPREWSRQRLTLQREIAILKVLDHPNIVKLYDAFEKDEKFYLIMEYVSGGELYQHISTKKVLTEVEARKFFRQLVSALEYCHSSLIIHRDLKLENVLLDSEGNIKITDFGFSNFIEPGKLFQTFCGSPMYSAPEIFAGQRYLGPPVDIWSLGVILFSMVSGYLPFSDVRDIRVLRRRVCRGEYQIPDHLSVDCQKLIKRMMRVRQEQRLTVQEIRRHPWVNKGYDSKPESYLQSYPKVVHPLPEVVHQLIALGFSRDECVRHLANNKPKDQIVATYYHIIQSKKGLSEGNSSPTRTPSPPRTSTPAASITETLPPTPQLWERLVHAFGLKE